MFKTASEGRPNPFSCNTFAPDTVDFIQSMLTHDVQKRPTVAELLDHKFLKTAETRRNMEHVITQIFIQNVVGLTGF
jgi:serine/threonine protein kinase